MKQGDQRPQCAKIVGATASRRRQCSRPAVKGDYCTQHASIPDPRAVKASLYEHVDKAIDALGQIVATLEPGDADAARHDNNRIKAAIAILDRTGHGPSHTVKVDDIRREIEAELGNDDDGDGGTEPA